MKKTLLTLLLLPPCAAFAAAPPTFVLPTSAKGTNIQLTTPAITGGTNTGQIITGATITGSITGTNAVLTTPAITGGTNTGSIITGATITGGTVASALTGTNANLTTPTITGATFSGTLSGGTFSGGSFAGSLASTNAVLTTPSVTGGTNTSSLFLNSTLTGFTSSLQTNTDLTASRVLVSDPAQRITNSAVSTTTLGYLDATSSIQTQLNAKLAATNGTASGGTFTGATNVNPVFSGVLTVPVGSSNAPSITFSNDSNTGIYSGAADVINFVTAGTNSLIIRNSGVQIGESAAPGGAALDLGVTAQNGFRSYNTISGAASGAQFAAYGTFAGDVTGAAYSYISSPTIASATQTVSAAYGLYVSDYTKGASATITSQYGIRVADQTKGSGNNFGIFLGVTSGSGKYSIYSSTAPSFFNGNVGIGTASAAYILDISGQARILGTNAIRFGGTSGATDDTVRISQSSANNLLLTATTTTTSGDFVVGTKVKITTLTKTANYTLTSTDPGIIFADATGGAVTITLPAASASSIGCKFEIYKVDSSGNAVTIAANGADTLLTGSTTSTTAQSNCLKVTGYTATSWIVNKTQ